MTLTMKIHIRYHVLKHGGRTRCPAVVWSDQRDGRCFIRCISTRDEGRPFCTDHDRLRLSPAARKTLSNRWKALWTPLGRYPRPSDHRCTCYHRHLVWMWGDPKDVDRRCVIHGRRVV